MKFCICCGSMVPTTRLDIMLVQTQELFSKTYSMDNLEGIINGLKRKLMLLIGILYLAHGQERCQTIIEKKS